MPPWAHGPTRSHCLTHNPLSPGAEAVPGGERGGPQIRPARAPPTLHLPLRQDAARGGELHYIFIPWIN